ncbi:hypothetical protein ACTA71_012039 [Dictyostelium dimigraforme]
MPFPRKPNDLEKKQEDPNNQCIESIKMGFLMGAGVGATFGSCMILIMFAAKKLPRHLLLRSLGSSALKMGGMFGCFMGIGGALRCEEDEIKINKNKNKNINPVFKNSNTNYDISKFYNNNIKF